MKAQIPKSTVFSSSGASPACCAPGTRVGAAHLEAAIDVRALVYYQRAAVDLTTGAAPGKDF